MIQIEVLYFQNGAWLFSGDIEECRKYCRQNGYTFVKAEGQYGEYWYVE